MMMPGFRYHVWKVQSRWQQQRVRQSFWLTVTYTHGIALMKAVDFETKQYLTEKLVTFPRLISNHLIFKS